MRSSGLNPTYVGKSLMRRNTYKVPESYLLSRVGRVGGARLRKPLHPVMGAWVLMTTGGDASVYQALPQPEASMYSTLVTSGGLPAILMH